MNDQARPREVVEGVHRAGTMRLNWYLVEADDGVTLVDTGLPSYHRQLEPALSALGRKPSEVKAIVLTHGHVDHMGGAAAAHELTGAPVLVHEADEEITLKAKTPRGQGSPLPYLRRPAALAWIAHIAASGGLRPPKPREVTTFADGDVLDVPGSPRVIHAPGHTDGEVLLKFEDRGALFVGDALFTYGTMTGETGPQIGPKAFTVDVRQALDSLDLIAAQKAEVLLPGHGDPWHRDPAVAVAEARERGPA